MISCDVPIKNFKTILGHGMAYVECGNGAPVVFLHGNPTSSYLWRNIMPVVAPHARCIAPDLIGMGDSSKLPGDDPARYGFLEHRRYLEALLDQLGVSENVVIVGHDWGGALGIDWARRHSDIVRGVVYFETTVRPRMMAELDPNQREFFQSLRSSEGEKMVLEENLFVEQLLPNWIIRDLNDAEMAEYRRPFKNAGQDRMPTLVWPREILIDGEPAHMVPIIEANEKWMASGAKPKLFIKGDPGAVISASVLDHCRTWQNQEEVTVRGKHYLQEDSPAEIGEAIVDWLAKHPVS